MKKAIPRIYFFRYKEIFIQRSYTTNPTTLENGTTVKDVEVKANAYEITVEVRNNTPAFIRRN